MLMTTITPLLCAVTASFETRSFKQIFSPHAREGDSGQRDDSRNSESVSFGFSVA